MNSKKLALIILAAICGIILSFLSLTATAHWLKSCSESKKDYPTREIIVLDNGMKLELNLDKTEFTFKSRGECTDTEIVIPSVYNNIPITGISIGAFRDYAEMTSVTIPQSVKYIGDSAFSGCSGLTQIDLPENLTYIGEKAFDGCTALQSVTLPDGISSIYGDAFLGCDSLQYNIYDNAKYLGSKNNPYFALIKAVSTNITKCDINPNTKIISNGTYGNKVSFVNCNSLKSITIPDSVDCLGGWAFYGCKNLTSVTIGSGVKEINSHTFSNCAGLTEFSIPDSVTQIGSYAFSSCKNLASINIGCGVKEIDNGAFSNCTNLTEINFSEGLTEIGDEAFMDCSSLQTVNFPDSLECIESDAFKNCIGLTNIHITKNVSALGIAFIDCNSLTGITVSEDNAKYKSINNCILSDGANGMWLNLGCKTSIIPNCVTYIDSYAFCGIEDLTSIEIPNSVTYIGKSAFGWSGLTEITIPSSVERISEDAFVRCSNLKKVVLCNGVKELGESAFAACNELTEFVMPASVTEIGYEVFDGCYNLTVDYQGTLKQWDGVKKGNYGFMMDHRYTGKYKVHCTDGDLEM